MKRTPFLPVFLALLLTVSCRRLQPGDLIFHVVGTGNAITAVTPGGIDHVGIYLGRDSVIEAIPREGVVITPLRAVLSREPGCYVAGRVGKADRRRSIAEARSYLGRRYDSLYLAGNDAVYCSELVLLAYTDRYGTPLLQPVPMTFRDSTGRIPDHWVQLYSRHQMDVPEGLPGSNPGELARRWQVRIIKKLK